MANHKYLANEQILISSNFYILLKNVTRENQYSLNKLRITSLRNLCNLMLSETISLIAVNSVELSNVSNNPISRPTKGLQLVDICIEQFVANWPGAKFM